MGDDRRKIWFERIALTILAFGLVVAGAGLVMQGEGVHQTQVCIHDKEPPAFGENCPTVSGQTYNDGSTKDLFVFGGGGFAVLGTILLFVEPPDPEDAPDNPRR